jgi:hypothetical protein
MAANLLDARCDTMRELFDMTVENIAISLRRKVNTNTSRETGKCFANQP